MASNIILNGDYDYTQYRYSGATATTIDATDATWIVANSGGATNLYPFLVENAQDGINIFGASFKGTVSQTDDWTTAYINSAALMVRNTKNANVSDIKISDPWDAIRIAGSSGGFDIHDTWVTGARDDAIENDDGNSGTIRDSLFDGVFSGISLGNKNTPNRTDEVVEIDNVLMRMESYLYKGQLTHASPMKMENNSPKLRITDSVFAIEDPDHIGDWRLDLAWDKTIESSGNVFLNLSDKPLPNDYPMPGNGWTVLQGQEARDYWEQARAKWIATYEGDVIPTPDNDDPVDTQVDVGNDGNDGDAITGKSGQDTLTGTSDDDVISGRAGADTLTGGAGNDELRGGAGNDVLRGGAGNDVLRGSIGKDDLRGGGGNDMLHGGVGDDNLQGGVGHDVVSGKKGADTVTGGAGNDTLRGGAGNDNLRGDAGNDKLHGGMGNDVIAGKDGADTLTGGGGRDVFLFDTAPNVSTNLDVITDFNSGIDKILLDSSVFKSLATGVEGQAQTLDEAYFEISKRADDANDHIMYEWNTGALYYDADGNGAGGQVQIAQLDEQLDISHSDFLFI